jgi:2-dehydro-3-deoxygluconokinase
MNKVVTFGEIMLRLSTERHLRFGQSKAFAATYGRGEFNVAVSLAKFGLPVKFVTAFPANELGESSLRMKHSISGDINLTTIN